MKKSLYILLLIAVKLPVELERWGEQGFTIPQPFDSGPACNIDLNIHSHPFLEEAYSQAEAAALTRAHEAYPVSEGYACHIGQAYEVEGENRDFILKALGTSEQIEWPDVIAEADSERPM